MARTRSQSSPRLNRDASRLVALAHALDRSGSKVEDLYWEAQLAEAITCCCAAAMTRRWKARWTISRKPIPAPTKC